MSSVGLLTLAALVWVGVHVGIAGTRLRQAIAGRIGDAGFRGLFSLFSVAAITALVMTYRQASTAGSEQLWLAPPWLGWILVLLMALAFVLFVGSVTVPNPTSVGGERAMGQESRGLLRVTRHPMLWSFATWSAVHIVGSGDLVSLLFFGAFGVTALAGMPSIDAKLAKRDPQGWARLREATSILPFGAIMAGRNRLVVREIGWIAPVAGLALWVVLLVIHPRLFGVSPLPR